MMKDSIFSKYGLRHSPECLKAQIERIEHRMTEIERTNYNPYIHQQYLLGMEFYSLWKRKIEVEKELREL